MKILCVLLLIGSLVTARAEEPTNSASVAASDLPLSGTKVETLICIRHGEKPKGGLGQLTCRGLNRSLALPDVLLAKYGQPKFVFAPNPTEKVDGLHEYNYIRPLMTIEPTAIRCGLPINTQYGYSEIGGLEKELSQTEYQNTVIFVAWEHVLLDDFAKKIVKDNGGNAAQVPDWPGNDYDTIFVIKITQDNGKTSVSFSIDREGLNGMSDECPGPAK
jgi:hypothetical protein